MYHIIFIKTENIAVDEIGRILCSHLLACAHTYFYIKLLCMNDAVTCKIVAHYSAVQKNLNPTIHISCRNLVGKAFVL